MIEHVSIPVRDFEKSKKFYLAALKPLGYELNMEFPGAAGFMADGHTSFWIVQKLSAQETHVAFLAKTRKAVNDFHVAALEAGGKNNGKPGLRTDYSPDYYAAFIHDPDRHNIEAVCYEEAKEPTTLKSL
ncbi:MAG: VOC family protein [Candidatus Liptonbacteria bacterium]|nr:VOC family protein [Candidatus Liptonbacteria bacterium]